MRQTLGPATHALLRVGAGMLFLQHGLQKVIGVLGGIPPSGGPAPMMSQLGAAGLIETIGGVLMILGLLAQPVAALLTLEMIAAYVIAHLPQGGWPVQNQGELALLYALIWGYIAANGAGPYSVDAWLRGSVSTERRRLIGDRRRHSPLPA